MFDLLKKLFRKSGPINSSSQLAQFLQGGKAMWNLRDYNSYAREGYCKNIVAYHCISKVSQAVADIPLLLYVKDKEVEKHPVIDLLNRPNPFQGYNKWMRQLIMYRLISGNSYIYANLVSTGRVMELMNFRPDRVFIKTNDFNIPVAYEYTINGEVYNYPVDPVTYDSEIIHIKEPNPVCDLYGLSPIAAAAMSIDQHNESGEWNKKLLENSARPPGVLVMKASDSLTVESQENLDQLSEKLNEKFAGSKNAGKIPILNADLDWKSMGMSPSDMDWINGKSTSARDICLAFGYPALLLGMPEGATYNNYSEAKLALYEETVIPLLQDTLCELSHYISAHMNIDLDIRPDLDKVTALSPRREVARSSAREDMLAGVITPNEAREESGYSPVPNGDDLLVPAGKLPLSFDSSSLDKGTYAQWLKAEGFDDHFIKQMVNLAYKD